MKIRSFISYFIVFLVALSMISEVKAQNNTLSLKSPINLHSYKPGDVIEINWSSDFIPLSHQGVTVNLLDQKNKRYRIGYITGKRSNGLYTLKWKIPENFFAKKKIKSETADFRIEIRAGQNIQNRIISGKNLINISKTAITQPVQTDSNNADSIIQNSDQTNIQLTDKSQFIARYVFKSLYEPWKVKKLTVVNDTQSDGFDPDPNEVTDAVDKVYIRYPDESGILKISSAPYANGKAIFSGLDFYIPSRSVAYLELYADAIDPKIYGEKFSGKIFRLGIQDKSNNTSTFEAVGLTSDTTINTTGPLQINSSPINEFIVKNSVLSLDVISRDKNILVGGENDLFEFSVSSDSASLGRLVFDVNQDGLTSLDNAKIYRNGQFLTLGNSGSSGDAYLMWDSGPASCFAQLPQNGAGTGMDCNGGMSASAKLILTFSKEEVINGANTYKLSFNAGGVNTGDSVTIRLNHDDDFEKPVIAGSDTLNGKIYNGGSGPELFANPTDFASEATVITNRNIIWSDRSADYHNYPILSPALLPTTDTSNSADWSNGYLLGLNGLPAVTSVR